ncbi:hypothetical protein BT96DRAFT_925320 [Gymnopus androsaceus JB14]|uniref:Uncharacterized protein n=1 Tax=Gymnopus androsaceus JB14 TaxID=1447944 RepID=A0A6A4H1W1_9AGAR|nr:hypothetical protein BT96DRAFT_928749 [Gymnopus androsaceus JB14]KAE9391364.1 hypothetical protein BT96DRAFT_925320 [Gymnopus androsaceus JB14]
MSFLVGKGIRKNELMSTSFDLLLSFLEQYRVLIVLFQTPYSRFTSTALFRRNVSFWVGKGTRRRHELMLMR